MKEQSINHYVKRTHRDYSMGLKLQLVKEIKGGKFTVSCTCRKYGIQSQSTVVAWLRKFGNFDHTPSNMPKTP